MESPAGPFVRHFDAHDLVDTFVTLDLFDIDDVRIADEAHDGLTGAFTDIDLEPLGFNVVN